MRDHRAPGPAFGSIAFPMFIAGFVALIATLVVIGWRDASGGRDPARARNMGPLLDVAPTDGPTVVASGNADPACFVPWSETTRLFRYEPRPAPYRVALVNGYIGNDWRRQMIATAKAYADRPEVGAKLKEFKIVSTGEDVGAQRLAVDAFIDSGFDAILLDAQDPAAFAPAIKRANEAGIVLVAFDNTLDSDQAINIDVDQKALGRFWAEWLVRTLPRGGKLLEVRGLAGTTVDRDRHAGAWEVLNAPGRTWDTVEVRGKWDDRTAYAAVAEALAGNQRFDAVMAQAGDNGVLRALIEAGHPFVPYGGENENGFRKACARFGEAGLHCASGGTGPAQVAVALKVALAALEGRVVPQSIRLPLATVTHPDLKDGRDYYSGVSDGFFVGNAFPTCGIAFTPSEILARDAADR